MTPDVRTIYLGSALVNFLILKMYGSSIIKFENLEKQLSLMLSSLSSGVLYLDSINLSASSAVISLAVVLCG